MLAYLAVGALGFDVFTASSAEIYGLAYMMGGTAGYLVGFVMAALAMGMLAARGWDRSIGRTLVSMAIGNVIIMVPGVLWLGVLYGWDQPILDWGLWPFLPGAVLKTALAAMVFPAAWRMVGEARG
jgi:biotin transport system substrate-specific component